MEKSTIEKLLIATVITVISICLLISAGVFVNFLKEQKEEQRIREYENARQRITTKTEVIIPNDAEIVYHFYELGFQSSIQYTCLKFKEDPTELLQKYSFIEGPYEDFEKHFEGYYNGWYWSPVPDEYEVNFDDNYYGLIKGTNFLIFFPDNLILIAYLKDI